MLRRFRSKPVPLRILVLLLLIAALAFWFFVIRDDELRPIDDFDSCVAAGNPVLETSPPQCTYNGQSFFNADEAPYDPKQDLLQ